MADRRDIEAALALAEARTGVRGGKSRIPLIMAPVASKSRRWTEREDDFIREHQGRLAEAEIARRLGRTLQAVHIHSEREMQLARPSKDPRILTAEHVGMGLGVDSKSVHMLMDRGLMPMRRLPMGRPVRVVDRLIFIKWMLEPMHWLYFKPERVGALRARVKRPLTAVYDYGFWEQARKVLKVATRKWKDEWLTPGQAADQLGVHRHNINSAIRAGTLQATRWGNWRILKSALPKGLKINALGKLVKKIYPQGHNPIATKAISTWWKGKKRQWPGGPAIQTKGNQNRRRR